jgi:hypothetical protein
MLPRLKTTPPHQILSYLTLTKKLISNVFVKGIFGYLFRIPLRVDTYNYVSTSITGSFSFTPNLTKLNNCSLVDVSHGILNCLMSTSIVKFCGSCRDCVFKKYDLTRLSYFHSSARKDASNSSHFHATQDTGYFTSDNECDGIENATHNTFRMLTWIFVF